jgi:hypothetical protein
LKLRFWEDWGKLSAGRMALRAVFLGWALWEGLGTVKGSDESNAKREIIKRNIYENLYEKL